MLPAIIYSTVASLLRARFFSVAVEKRNLFLGLPSLFVHAARQLGPIRCCMELLLRPGLVKRLLPSRSHCFGHSQTSRPLFRPLISSVWRSFRWSWPDAGSRPLFSAGPFRLPRRSDACMPPCVPAEPAWSLDAPRHRPATLPQSAQHTILISCPGSSVVDE